MNEPKTLTREREIKAMRQRIQDFFDEHTPGMCKMLSLGDACPCLLCARDNLQAALSPPEGAEELRSALDAAAYALFQLKRFTDMPQHAIDFASSAHEKACAVLDREPSDFIERKGALPKGDGYLGVTYDD